MNNFEQIAATPEALGAFLSALPVADGPWDAEFRRVFCAGCSAENCDGDNCPHSAERNNPLWWLNKGTAQDAPDYEFSPEEVAAIEKMAQAKHAHSFPLMVIPDKNKGTLTIEKDGVKLGLGGAEAAVLAQIILDRIHEVK